MSGGIISVLMLGRGHSADVRNLPTPVIAENLCGRVFRAPPLRRTEIEQSKDGVDRPVV